jgi:hypothetical protein
MNTPSASLSSPSASTTDTTAVGSATSPRQPLTKEQRDAIFAKAAATMQPTRAPSGTELLEWKPQIMEYYAKGFSAVQLRDMLHAGGVASGERVIQRFIAKHLRHRRRSAASPKRPLSDTSDATSATPSAASEPSGGRQSAVSGPSAVRQSQHRNRHVKAQLKNQLGDNARQTP